MPVPPRRAATNCAGCLGSRQCWICLGEGRQERPDHSYVACQRCHGTGRCAECAPVDGTGLSGTPGPTRTIVLDSAIEQLQGAGPQP